MPIGDATSGAAGRPALAISRDTDYEDIVRAVNSLPKMAEAKGIDFAVAWAQTELRSLIDLIALADPRSPEEAKAAQRIHLALSEGFVRVYARSDRIGFLARRDFLAAVTHTLFAPTIRAVFNRTTADTRQPYVAVTGDR